MPKPTEASMYVMALTALLLLISNGQIWSEFGYILAHDERGRSGLLFGYVLIGMFLSIYHAFSKREKEVWEMQIMKWFTVMTLAVVAISTSVFIYVEKQPVLLVFAIWNLIQAFALIFLSGKRYTGQYVKLPKRNATYIEIVLGTLVVIVILYIENLFNTHWSVAFSSVLVVWSILGSYFEYDEEKVVIKNLNQQTLIS